MSYIVSIAEGTYKPGINEIGDIVDVLPDGADLGPSLSTFTVTPVSNVTQLDLREKLNSKIPKMKDIYKAATAEWTEVTPEIKQVFQDGVDWKEFKNAPTYPCSIITLTEQDKIDLEDKAVGNMVTLLILDKIQDKTTPLNMTKITFVKAVK